MYLYISYIYGCINACTRVIVYMNGGYNTDIVHFEIKERYVDCHV